MLRRGSNASVVCPKPDGDDAYFGSGGLCCLGYALAREGWYMVYMLVA